MFEIIGVSLVILFTFFVILFPFFKKPTYNSGFQPLNKKVMEDAALMPFQYRDMVEMVNLIADFHREMKNPFFRRFWRYPFTEARQISHQRVLGMYLEKLQLLEVEHKLRDG